MNEFIEGSIACVLMIGGICTFTYWMISAIEKRIELKMDILSNRMEKIALEIERQSERTDRLYEMFIALIREGKK